MKGTTKKNTHKIEAIQIIDRLLRSTSLFLIFLLLWSCDTTNTPLTKIEIGKGWAGNTVNTVIFRHHGVLTFGNVQFAAFYDANENVTFVRRDLQTNAVEYSTLEGEFNVRDAHNAISLGVDKNGYLHIAFDHHGSPLQYRRSTTPMSINHWSNPMPMTGEKEEKVTYPAFLFNPVDSALLFLYRRGNATNGEAFLKKYNPQQQQWFDFDEPILSGNDKVPTACPYWNHPVFDERGALHLSFVWRIPGKEGKVNNIGMAYATSRDNGMSWANYENVHLSLPITRESQTSVWDIPELLNLINQCGMSTDTNGCPHIVYYSNDDNHIPQYKHLWFDGKMWNNSTLKLRTKEFSLEGKGTLQIPMSRPEVLIGKDNRVHILFRADITNDQFVTLTLFPPDYNPEKAKRTVLWKHSVGFAEPIIDRHRWQRKNILTMLIQYNHQPKSDKNVDFISSDVFLVDWTL
jgi:hypothetical protein